LEGLIELKEQKTLTKVLRKKLEIKKKNKDWNEKPNTWEIVIEWLNWKE
jgi:hypothetical protein